MKSFQAAALTLLMCLTVLAMSPASTSAATPARDDAAHQRAAQNRPCLTAGEYRRVKRGMTLNRVGTIIGTRGKVQRGDVALHVRRYISCVAVENEFVEQCMVFQRQPRPGNKWSAARVTHKDVHCG